MTRLSILLSVLALAACAARPMAAEPQVVQREGDASLQGRVETGTRLPARGTDRMVRTIGNQGFREDATSIKGLGNDTGMRGN